MEYKTQDDYMKEIANRMNNAKCYEIEKPTIKDVKKLKEFDFILTKGKYSLLKIRKKFIIDTVLNIPTVFFREEYEVGDNIMGMIPELFTAEEVLEVIKGFKE